MVEVCCRPGNEAVLEKETPIHGQKYRLQESKFEEKEIPEGWELLKSKILKA